MNAYDETLPSVAEFKDTSKRFVWLLAVLLVLGLIGFFSARPIYKVVKTKRALGMADEVEANLQAGKWDEAVRGLKVVLELAPTEPRIIRLAAEYCTQRSMVEGINYWQMLLSKPGSTRQDLLKYLELCLNFNRTDIVVPQLESLLATNRNDSELLRLYVRAVQASAPPAAAIQAGRIWLNNRPDDEEAQLALGTMLTGSPQAEERGEGRRLLWGAPCRRRGCPGAACGPVNGGVPAAAQVPDGPARPADLHPQSPPQAGTGPADRADG